MKTVLPFIVAVLMPLVSAAQVTIPPLPTTLPTTTRSAAPAEQPDSIWLKVALAGSIGVHAADLSASSWALGRGGFRETNPFLRPFDGHPVHFAIAKTATAVAINAGLYYYRKEYPKTVLVVTIAQAIAVGYVAHHNTRQR